MNGMKRKLAAWAHGAVWLIVKTSGECMNGDIRFETLPTGE